MSVTPIGDLHAHVQRAVKRLFSEALDVWGFQGREGWSVDLTLPDHTDLESAVSDLADLLRTLPVPRDTYIVDDDLQEIEVFREAENE